jgi:predicted amidohydrolase YtcJ
VRLANARIGDRVVDVQVDDGVITAMTDRGSGGALETSRVARGEDTTDLDGRWLLPGLWDNHVHFSQWSLQSQRLDVSEAASAAEVAQLIARALQLAQAGSRAPADKSGAFVAVGFRDGLWPDAPGLEALDAVSADPVTVISGDLHAVWLNSAALDRFGFGGHPTGLLREDDAFRVTSQLGTVDDATLDGWAADAASAAATRGVVGIVDYEMAWNLDSWRRRQAGGLDSLRVEFGIYTEHLQRAIELGLRTGDAVGELLTVGNFKILIDGSLNTRTAYCYDSYPGGGHGVLTVEPGELVSLLRRASEAGIRPSVHAIGDRANTVALDAFEAAGCAGRIEHAQLIRASDLPRFGRLGVAASVQPDHALDDRDVADHYWSGRTDRAFPLRSLLDSGAEILLGSDAPVSPLDPWVTIAAAVGRTRGGREPWHPEQAIGVEEAIAASTRTVIAVGQRADFVAVELDPASAGLSELSGMPIGATVMGGRFTYRSAQLGQHA